MSNLSPDGHESGCASEIGAANLDTAVPPVHCADSDAPPDTGRWHPEKKAVQYRFSRAALSDDGMAFPGLQI